MNVTELIAKLADVDQKNTSATVSIMLKPSPDEPLIVGEDRIAAFMGISRIRFVMKHQEAMRKAGLLYVLPGKQRNQIRATHQCCILAYMIAISQLGIPI